AGRPRGGRARDGEAARTPARILSASGPPLYWDHDRSAPNPEAGLSTALEARRRLEPPGAIAAVRTLADQAFSRAAGAPLVHGNAVRLLRDARENYPAWLSAIAAARESIHFESYIVHDDEVGRRFSEALVARAREGVRVRVIYDWLGAFGKTGSGFWGR